jgi:hypothetical protein
MRSKLAIILSVVFFVLYSLVLIGGSSFLVTWGASTWVKNTLNILLSFPISWSYLVSRSIAFLLINIFFWTTIVYVIVTIFEKFFRAIRAKVK